MYKYIALDFDGTILNERNQISNNLVETLIKLQDHGIKVILCSGRNFLAMNNVIKKINTIKYDTYIISSNGGEIYEVKDGNIKLIHKQELSIKQVLKLNELLKNDTKYFYSYNGPNVEMGRFNFVRCLIALYFKKMPSFKIQSPATKLIIMDTKEHIDSIYEEVKLKIRQYDESINVFRSVHKGIEITPFNSTKGQALKFIFELNGYDSNQLLVFGDGENDIDMFEYAGFAVAMNNAFDSTKAHANDITLSNKEDGVYDYIKKNIEILDI